MTRTVAAPTRALRLLLVTALAVIGLSLAPAAASATPGVAQLYCGYVYTWPTYSDYQCSASYMAADDETANDVTVTYSGSYYTVTDAAGVLASAGCTQNSGTSATCGPITHEDPENEDAYADGYFSSNLYGGNDEGSLLTGRSDYMGGGAGNDVLSAGSGNQGLSGEDGQDWLSGGAGNDGIDGGAGTDLVSYAYCATPVTASLAFSELGYGGDNTGHDGCALDEILDGNGNPYRESLGHTIEGVEGGSAADDLTGNDSDNLLIGGDGDDTLDGDADGSTFGSNDTLRGGAGNDTMSGGSEVCRMDSDGECGEVGDWVDYSDRANPVTVDLGDVGTDGEAGEADVIASDVENVIGGSGADDITGSDSHMGEYGETGGENILVGGPGNDALHGAGADDYLRGGAGDDDFEGGPGVDLADYSDRSVAVDVDLSSASDIGGEAGEHDAVIGPIEGVRGGGADDTLDGNALENTIEGGAGDDALTAGDGTAAERDHLYGNAGDDTLTGDGGRENLYGGSGDDTATGGDDDDSLYGGAGADTLQAGPGDYDEINGGTGPDTIDGGPGVFDEVSYSDRWSTGVTVNLALPATPQGSTEDIDETRPLLVENLAGIENVEGTSVADTLTGDGGRNMLTGNAGDDVLDGAGGDADFLVGYDGDDELHGGDGNDDALDGGLGNDTLNGGAGDGDQLDGGAGADDLDGGPGVHDLADFAGFGGDGVTVTIGAGDADDGGADDVDDDEAPTRKDDVFSTIEDVRGGGGEANHITGTDGPNVLEGGAAADTLIGGDGNDELWGSSPYAFGTDQGDTLNGGPGDDEIGGGVKNKFGLDSDGADTIDAGTGQNTVRTEDATVDQVDCGEATDDATPDSAFADTAQTNGGAVVDNLTGCENVNPEPPTYCELNPEDPSCDPGGDPCAENPTLPECNPDPCVLDPGLPQCEPDPGDETEPAVSAGNGFLSYSPGFQPSTDNVNNVTITFSPTEAVVTDTAGTQLVAGDGCTQSQGNVHMVTCTRTASESGWGYSVYTAEGDDQVTMTGSGVDYGTLALGDGNDTATASTGSDYIVPGTGADTIDGGGEHDMVSYDDARSSGVTASLASNSGGNADDEATIATVTRRDVFSNVEGLQGTDFTDTLTGGDGDDYLGGGPGTDTLDGAGGADSLMGDTGADSLTGGGGTDTVLYYDHGAGVTVDADGQADDGNRDDDGAGGARDNVAADVENIVGTDFNDVLLGNAAANEIEGGSGADTILGGTAADTLVGGAGPDAIDSRDASADEVQCGDGSDQVAADGGDTVGPDCETNDAAAAPEVTTGVVAEDGTVATSGGAATADDTLVTAVQTPVAGPVTIAETKAVSETAPSGYSFLGHQVNIQAPDATATDPLRLVFRLDASELPAGASAATLEVFRNGARVPACTADNGQAAPDPCIPASLRETLSGGDNEGDVRITVLTSRASAWNLGLAAPATGGGTGGGDTGTGGGDTTTTTTTPTPTTTTTTTTTSTPAPAPSPAPAARDTVAPTVTATVAKAKLKAILAKGLAVTVKCSEACTGTAQLTVDKKTAKKLKLKKPVLGTGAVKSGKAVVKLSAAAKKALKKLKSLKATVLVTVADAAGNKKVTKKTLTLKR